MSNMRSSTYLSPTYEQAGEALDRLIKMAHGNSGGLARVADFLFAWWNGPDWGYFPIMHLKGLDRTLGRDVVTLMAYLVENDTCYASLWNRRADMERLIDNWRGLPA